MKSQNKGPCPKGHPNKKQDRVLYQKKKKNPLKGR